MSDFAQSRKERFLSSKKLKTNILKFQNIKSKFLDPYSYQAHHINPSEVVELIAKEFVDEQDTIDARKLFDEAWNGIMLSSDTGDIVHNGSHPKYNDFILDILSNIEMYDLEDFVVAAFYLSNAIQEIYNKAKIPYNANISPDCFAEQYLVPRRNELIAYAQQGIRDLEALTNS